MRSGPEDQSTLRFRQLLFDTRVHDFGEGALHATTASCWIRPVGQVAGRSCGRRMSDVPSHLQEFVNRYAAQGTFSLRLV